KVHDPAPLVCLASASARRRELLAQIGVPHVVSAAHLDEALRCGERAADYVVRMARAKALAVRERGVRLPVLAADTTVVLDEIVCGKPADEAESLAMLERQDRKSTRLNSSHVSISYAVFCLKKKKKKHLQTNHAKKTLTQ